MFIIKQTPIPSQAQTFHYNQNIRLIGKNGKTDPLKTLEIAHALARQLANALPVADMISYACLNTLDLNVDSIALIF